MPAQSDAQLREIIANYYGMISLVDHQVGRILSALDDAGFRALFRKSSVKRIGRDRFARNVMIAIGNSKDASLIAAARDALTEESPLVRGAAVWALSQLLPADEFSALASAAQDSDDSVRQEWRAAKA